MTHIVHPLDIIAAESPRKRRIPTSVIGYVDDNTFDGILADLLEHIPDLIWPQSIQTLNQMRRDPKLAAIIDGYQLHLRRAQWQLDGSNCRPEVVDLVADDLGLPIMGTDTHGAARTRGVSWNEHLQAALGMLVFGHAGFELQAELDDRGRARLVGLWERPQHTIATIHIEPRTGEFRGISQELSRGAFDEPEIPADRMVWYVHDREGAAWFGTSLLRPAYAPWLLKREMQRVLATSSRRFGMGVPSIEWAATANPTPAQFSEAQKAIEAARVGDRSGVTMPPGAMLKLIGLSGGTPDTLAFIKWLDHQMATSALMQHLDLGSTETGARALGESFINSWVEALEAIGEHIADIATRHIAARIVAWNWGDDEPVPRVTVSGVGSRREVTAQSLATLLESGALTVDPALDEWVRREFRLPPRGGKPNLLKVPTKPTPTPEPAPEPEPEPEPEPAPAPVQAATRWEQPTLPIAAQAPEDGDQEQQDHHETLLALLAAWPLIATPILAALVASATTAAATGAVATLANLPIPATAIRQVTTAVLQPMQRLAQLTADRTRTTLTAQGVTVDPVKMDTRMLRQHARAAVTLLINGYRSAAARAALTAFTPGTQPEAVAEAVQEAVEGITTTATQDPPRGWVAGELGSLLHTAQHLGRVAVFAALQRLGTPVDWVADESHEDRNRCRHCAAINGTTFPTLAAALAAYPSGKYLHCAGRWRCRGRLVARIRRVEAANPNWRHQPRWPKGTPGGLGGQWRGDNIPDITPAPTHRLTPTLREASFTVTVGRRSWRDPDTSPRTEDRPNYIVEGRVTGRDAGVLTITGGDGKQAQVFDPAGRTPVGAVVRLETTDRTGRMGIFTARPNSLTVLQPPPAPEPVRAPDPTTPLPDLRDLLDAVQRLRELEQDPSQGTGDEVEELVDRLRDAAEAVFDTDFGSLRTTVDDVSFEHGSYEVRGSIHTPDGVHVGVFGRSYTLDGDELVAHHDLLRLEPEVQGTGFAAAFNTRLEDWYRNSGVSRIELEANIDVGGYAWARAGYEFADEVSYQRIISTLLNTALDYEDRLTREDPDTDEAAWLRHQIDEAWQLLDRAGIDRDDPDFWDGKLEASSPSPWDISQVGRPPGGGRGTQWIGKEVLLGSSWQGVRWLR